MDNPNITMEEYIRLEEEKARRHGKVYNWETAKYGKIWYNEDVHDLRSVEAEFPAIVFNDELSSEKTLSREPTISSLIDFRISFGESDDEDYTVDLPSFPSPEPKVSCFDDLDFFKDFKNEFPAIIYNDALTSKSDFLTEPTLSPQHIDEFDLKNETSLSEYDEVEQSVLYFNDLFLFNIIYPDNLKSGKENDDNEIDIIQSSGGNVNTQGSNKLLEASHDKINKIFNVKSFIMELKVNIVTWNYLVNGMLLNLTKNLYVPFGIPFDPKRYYKDGVYTKMLWRPRVFNPTSIWHMTPLPPRDQRHLWLRYQVEGYTEDIVHDFEQRLEMIFGRQVNRVHTLDFEGLTPDMRQDLAERLRMVYTGDDGEFLRFAPSYTYIRDPVQRLCHRLISYNISRRGQAPEKVTATDLFYLRSMDRGATDVPYLVAQYLFRHAEGRKISARLLGGHFIGHLSHYFSLVSDDGLRGLSVVTRELPFIDMVAAAAALGDAEDAPDVDEGAQAILAPTHAPLLPPPATGRTMPQRLGRLEEEIQGLRQDVRSL
ncbi:hypothetical protein Tco_1571128 [Tanacetum coccineum]